MQGGIHAVCKCNKPAPSCTDCSSQAGQQTGEKSNCQPGSAAASSSNDIQGFPWSTVQQPMLEAYMEKVVKESMEKLVRQLLTANARQA